MKRPVFLTVWLTIITFAALLSLFSYTLGATGLINSYPNLPSWAIVFYTLLALIHLVAVVLLWLWRRFGFYIIIGFTIIVSSVNGVTMGISGITASLFAIVGIIILYLAMKPVWENFK